MSSDEKRPTIYLNNAGQALLSPEVQQVGMETIQQPPPADAEPDATRIRQLFEQLIQVPKTTFPDTTIAIHPSAAFAVTLAARNILRRKEQEALHTSYRVVCLQDQFASAVYPWQDICKETSSEESNSRIRVRMDVVQRNDKEYDAWTRAILEKLGDSESDPILAVCLPPLHWSDGTLIDLKLIGSVCKQKKVPFIVDATQAVGAYPISVKKIQPTMLVCSVHKWLRGPVGTCLSYISPDVYNVWMPLDSHGRNRVVGSLDGSGLPSSYYSDARKFDSGGKANPILLPMLKASMETVSRLNPKTTQQTLKALMEPLLAWVKSEEGSECYTISPGPRASHIVGLMPTGSTIPAEMTRMAETLRAHHGIVVAVRSGRFRISPYLHNTPEDIQTLIQGLKEVIKMESEQLSSPHSVASTDLFEL